MEKISKLLLVSKGTKWKEKLNVNHKNYDDETCLHVAIVEHKIDVAKLILANSGEHWMKKLNVNVQAYNGNTPLHDAIEAIKEPR